MLRILIWATHLQTDSLALASHLDRCADLNPIEQVFSKLKTLPRKAEPRCVETTWRQIGSLLDHFSAAECANYLRNSGYASTQ